MKSAHIYKRKLLWSSALLEWNIPPAHGCCMETGSEIKAWRRPLHHEEVCQRRKDTLVLMTDAGHEKLTLERCDGTARWVIINSDSWQVQLPTFTECHPIYPPTGLIFFNCLFILAVWEISLVTFPRQVTWEDWWHSYIWPSSPSIAQLFAHYVTFIKQRQKRNWKNVCIL